MKKLWDKPYKPSINITGYLILLFILQVLIVFTLLISVPRSINTKSKVDTSNITVKPMITVNKAKPETKIIEETKQTVKTLEVKKINHSTKTTTLSRGGNIEIKPLTERERIDKYVREICSKYNIDSDLVRSMIVSESDYDPNCTTGKCVGLMQVSTRWHADRAVKLNVTDFYDPYSNILLGVDYLSELFIKYEDPRLVLMLYNMKHETALNMYRNGEISYYAKTILARAEEYRKGE